MEDRMRSMQKRFSLLWPKETGGPDIMRSDRWRSQLEELWRVYLAAKRLMGEVKSKAETLRPSQYESFVDDLESLSGLMVSSMGLMYHSYQGLNFFQIDQFFAALRYQALAFDDDDDDDDDEDDDDVDGDAKVLGKACANVVDHDDGNDGNDEGGKKLKKKKKKKPCDVNDDGGVDDDDDDGDGDDGGDKPHKKHAQHVGDAPPRQRQRRGKRQRVRARGVVYEGGPKELSVWSTSSYAHYIPEGYTREDLPYSIRCPPALQRILQWTESDVLNPPGHHYITRSWDVSPPFTSDGPPVMWLNHLLHSSDDVEINDCAQCGHDLAKYFFKLGLKTLGKSKGKRGQGQGRGRGQGQDQLYWHDVIIIGSPIHQPECRFMRALRARGLEFVIENQELESPPPYLNKVFVVGGAIVQGVEAKIIVYVPELKRITPEEKALFSSSLRVSPPPPSHPSSCLPSPPLPPSSCLPSPPLPPPPSSSSCLPSPPPSSSSCLPSPPLPPPPPSCLPSPPLSVPSENCNQHEVGKMNKGENCDRKEINKGENCDRKEINKGENCSRKEISEGGNCTRNENGAKGGNYCGAGEDRFMGENHVSRERQEQEWLRRLGHWNREYIWHVGSRSLSHLVIFHV